jgi:hypothetical protein
MNKLDSSVMVFKAVNLSFIADGTTESETEPVGACSDGINFWVPLSSTSNLLLRF